MHAIKQIRKYLDQNHSNASATTRAKFARALTREGHISLSDLYAMSYEEFELAVDLLKDWRLDRYYADKTQFFDLGVRGAEAEQIRTS